MVAGAEFMVPVQQTITVLDIPYGSDGGLLSFWLSFVFFFMFSGVPIFWV